MKKSLVRNGRHQRPMLSVLERYGIGDIDGYGRGRWITIRDLSGIQSCMEADPNRIVYPDDIFVPGTNQHNHVSMSDFQKLFA